MLNKNRKMRKSEKKSGGNFVGWQICINFAVRKSESRSKLPGLLSVNSNNKH